MLQLAKSILVPIFFCLVAQISIMACGQHPILIGFAGQLSGISSDLGVQARNGATLALEEINAQGGIDGHLVRMLAKDDGNRPEMARQVDQELIDAGVVAIIGHMTSSQSMAALPVLEKAGVVLLSPTTSTPQLTGKKDMFFRVQVSSARTARALASFARHRLNLSRILTIKDTDNQAYSSPYNHTFLQHFQGLQGRILDSCSFSSIQGDIWGQVKTCLADKDPEGILIIASARDTASLVPRLKARTSGIHVLSSGWATTHSLLVHGGQTCSGLFAAHDGIADRQKAASQNFMHSYRERFGQKPSFAAEQGYHAMHVLAQALRKTKGQKQGLPQALSQTSPIQSLYGPLSLDTYGDAQAPVSILQVVNGTYVHITRMHPQGSS